MILKKSKKISAIILVFAMMLVPVNSFADTTDVPADVSTVTDAVNEKEEDTSEEVISDPEEIDNEDANPNPFTDVPYGSNYYNAVLWAYNANPQIVSGISATKFKPFNQCTRAQVVSFLWRMKGCPEPVSKTNPFKDVKSSDFYYKAVLWAYENKITAGVSSGSFGPIESCTRAQVATFIWKAAGSPNPSISATTFTDVPTNKSYFKPVTWAYENGIVAGKDATHFAPGNIVNRAQIVMFLQRTSIMRNKYTTVKDGVDYSAVYNYNYYKTMHTDVVKAIGDDPARILDHFVNYGMNEGRQAKADFNVFSYVVRYADLQNAYGYNYKAYYIHYINNGKKEGRIATGTENKAKAESVLSGNWKNAYRTAVNNYYNKFKDDKYATLKFNLIYINDDNIPELFCTGGLMLNNEIYTYTNKLVLLGYPAADYKNNSDVYYERMNFIHTDMVSYNSHTGAVTDEENWSINSTLTGFVERTHGEYTSIRNKYGKGKNLRESAYTYSQMMNILK